MGKVVKKLKAKFVGVVLAGGKSIRMGQDKALLTINTKSLLDRSIDLLQQLDASEVIVCRNDGSSNSVPDVYPELGPLSGIHAALHATDYSILLIPVDMPLLDVETLSPILKAGMKAQACCHYEAQPMPAFIVNNAQVREYLETSLSNYNGNKSALSLKRFLQSQQSITLKADCANKLINVNTPKQFLDIQ